MKETQMSGTTTPTISPTYQVTCGKELIGLFINHYNASMTASLWSKFENRTYCVKSLGDEHEEAFYQNGFLIAVRLTKAIAV